ncbi:PTS transporter subunit EIIC [Pseudaeromonas sharmana]|uniref:PTS transporter subunit EIIC n=1 Tax=Pseudaeromonas sharmana TaxID=328412 RepID=A0ABV8CRC7_9GAMM
MSCSRSPLAVHLLLPIALMPVASLMCWLGDGNSLLQALCWQCGVTLFALLPLLLAIQLARALQPEPFPLQALNAALGYLLLSSTLEQLAPELNHSDMIAALLTGIISARLYPRLARLRLPPLLHSFKGPAIILMLNGLVCLLTLLPLIPVLLWLEPELLRLGHHWLTSPDKGFALGFIYQLLTPLGLNELFHDLLSNHAALNQPQLSFLAAHYAIQLFGLPGMALAILKHPPQPIKRAALAAAIVLMLTSLLSGVTSPLLLVLLLVSPSLFFIHALLAGLIMAFCLQVKLHFILPGLPGDLVPLSIDTLPFGNLQFFWLVMLTFSVYYVCCRLLLTIWPNAIRLLGMNSHAAEPVAHLAPDSDLSVLAIGYLKALGGMGNLISMHASLTYLTIEVDNPLLLDNSALQQLGVITRFELDDRKLQLLVGPIAEPLADKIQTLAARQSLDLQPREFVIEPFSLR